MALTRITKGVIKPNENYDTHNINSTGIVTAIGLDVNGNGDISGNLSVGGVLTYEDVTSIDSVGIITARDGIHVGAGVSAVGVGTFGGLDVNGNGDVSGNLVVSSLLTASGLDINGDIDVDGHTNLDNVSIVGVATVTGSNINIEGGSALLSQLKINSTGRYRGIQLDENGTRKAHFQHDATDNKTIVGTAEGTLQFNSGDTPRVTLNSSGHWVPYVDSTYDLGLTGTRWRNVYADTLYGDGSNLTGISVSSDKIFENDTKAEVVDAGSNGHFKVETEGIERFRVISTGETLIKDVDLIIGSGQNTQAQLNFFSNDDNASGRYARIRKNYNSPFNFEYFASTSNSHQSHVFYSDLTTERLRIKPDGTITINSTGSQPSATVSGYQFDAVAATFRLGSGAGASGTTSSSISLMGSNHNANIENGANSGAQMNLYNYNTNDGNSSAVSFINSNSLSVARILGLNVSHSSRTGALVFMTSNGSHPTEKLRIDSSGRMILGATGTIGNSYSNNFTVSEASGNVGMQFAGNNSTSNYASIYFGDAGHRQKHYIETQLGTNGHFSLGTIGTGPIRFSNSGGERFHIKGNGGVGINTSNFSSSLNNEVGLAIHGESNDNCRIVFTTPTKSNPPSAIGYFGLNRFGVDTYDGLEIRDVTASYATRFKIDQNGNRTIPNNPCFVTQADGSTYSSNNDNLLAISAVWHNIGGHYKTSGSDLGKFICPIDGIYFFYLCYTGENSVSAPVMGFKINNSFSGTNFTLNYGATYDGSYLGHTFSMSANDYIQASVRDWNGTTPNAWNTWWGGYLLQ